MRRPDIAGVQVVYSWKSLETAKDQYDFSQIERDLAYLAGLDRKLFIQIQDRFFEDRSTATCPPICSRSRSTAAAWCRRSDNPGENQPEGHGWVAQQWNPQCASDFRNCCRRSRKKFDGRVCGRQPAGERPPTSTSKNDKTGFTCDGYFAATLENIAFARKEFSKSHVVQYTNFWPCEWDNDREFMSRAFEFAKQNGIGLGGPDIVPYKKAQMKNSYPFFNRYKGQLSLVAMAVQEPTLTYTNPETEEAIYARRVRRRSRRTTSGVDVIFWSATSPWLRAAMAAAQSNVRPAGSGAGLRTPRGSAQACAARARPCAGMTRARDHRRHGLARVTQPVLREAHQLLIAARQRLRRWSASRPPASLRNSARSKR